ncbi:unnamed protein product, partial [Rotaria sp. Silwood1]
VLADISGVNDGLANFVVGTYT